MPNDDLPHVIFLITLINPLKKIKNATQIAVSHTG